MIDAVQLGVSYERDGVNEIRLLSVCTNTQLGSLLEYGAIIMS